jgi:hypothetical protein
LRIQDQFHAKMNALLGNKENLLIDPRTDEEWTFKTIPRSCFEDAPVKGVADNIVILKERWEKARDEILEQRRENALAQR